MNQIVGLVAILIFSNFASAGPAVNSNSARSIENVFSGATILGKARIQEQLISAPAEVRTLVESNFSSHGRSEYFKISANAKSAYALAPASGSDLTRAFVTSVNTDATVPATQSFVITSRQSPKSIELLNQHRIPSEIVKEKLNGHPVPVHFTYDSPKAAIQVDHVYSILKDGVDDRRFTLSTRLISEPKDGIKGHYVTDADGQLRWKNPPGSVVLEAKLQREHPDTRLTKADLSFQLKNDTSPRILNYKLPPARDGKSRQILEIKFSLKAEADEQFMTVTASDGERLIYAIERDGDRVKLGAPTRAPLMELEMAEYNATVKPLKNRQSINTNVEFESAAGR